MLCFVSLMFALPQIRGRGKNARAVFCFHDGCGSLLVDACPWEALFQNRTWIETIVASEGELQSALASRDFNHQIIVDAQEIALTASLRIDGTGWVSLVGNGKGATRIRCATNGTGTALVIRCVIPSDVNSLTAGMEPCRRAHVQLTRLRFVGCGNSAVVVERDPLQSGEEGQAVDFDRVEFFKNGRVKQTASGAAVNARRCPEQPCRHLSLCFRECQFVDNRGSEGGAICAEDADIDIRQSTFEGNEAIIAGGAIYVHNDRTAALTIEDSKFAKNKAWGTKEFKAVECTSVLTSNATELSRGTGGAVFANSPLSIDIRASAFVQNAGCNGGGAIALLQRNVSLEENAEQEPFSVSDAIFRENVAYCGSQRDALDFVYYSRGCSKGGALVYEALDESPASWRFKNSSFLGNRAIVGGALHIRGFGSSVAEHEVISCDFDENTAIRSGGAIYLREVRMTIRSSRFTKGRAFYGGHILMIGPTHLTTERDPERPETETVLADAVGYFGGALLTTNEGSLLDPGSAFATPGRLFVGSLDLSALVVRNNIAYGGGGGFSIRDASLTPVFRDVLIENNSAILGGGLEVVSAPNITFEPSAGRWAIIRNNTAAVGGGMRYLTGRFSTSLLKASRISFRTRDIEMLVLCR